MSIFSISWEAVDSMNTFITQAVHPAPSGKRDIHASLRTPVYDSVAFEFETAKEMALAFVVLEK